MRVVRAVSSGSVLGQDGAEHPVEIHFTFDGSTLALLGLHGVQPGGEVTLRAEGGT